MTRPGERSAFHATMFSEVETFEINGKVPLPNAAAVGNAFYR